MDSIKSQIPYANQVQALITFLIREPVKEAVRAELREQENEESATSDDSPMSNIPVGPTAIPQAASNSVPWKLVVGVVALAISGLVYRKRRSTTEDTDNTAGLENRVTGPNSDTDGETRAASPAEYGGRKHNED